MCRLFLIGSDRCVALSSIQYPSVAASKKNALQNCRRARNLFEAVRNIPAREILRAVDQLL